jgi:hypothetical protein
VRFSGVLRDLAGQPLTGSVDVHFAIYKGEADAAAIWEETQTLQLDEHGRYTVLLGATQPEGLPLLLFESAEARWLGVSAGTLPEQPRVLLVSVPYALKASDADTLGGKPASAFVTTDAISNSKGQTQTLVTTSVQGQAAIVGRRAEDPPRDGPPWVGGSGVRNYLPIWTDSTALGNSTLYETDGRLGIGNTKPAGTLDVSGGAFVRGTLQLPATWPATRISGANSNALDFEASAFNISTRAAVPQLFRWQAEPAGNDTGSPSGTLNLLYGSGSGTPAETGLSVASNGVLSFASGQTFPGTGAVTSVGSGAGLTGGPITTSGTLSIAPAGVTNAMLANPSLTVAAGTDLTGGGSVPLGGSVTLNLDTSMVPTLAAASNIFAGSIAATSFTGSGAGLTGLNPANLSAGTAAINISGNAATAMTAGAATTAATAGNAAELGGVAAGNYARLDIDNSFTGNQSVAGNVTATGSVSGNTASFTGALSGTSAAFSGALTTAGAVLPATGTATASQGFISNPFDTVASSFNSGSSAAQNQLFRWQAEPAANNTASPSATLNLLFGANGATPGETGLSLSANGTINFVPGQTFPSTVGSITGLTAGTGLSGGGTSGNVTLNVDQGVVAFQSDLTNGVNTAETFATGAANAAQTGAENYANNTFLPLTGGTLTGGLTGTTATFSGNLQAAAGTFTGGLSASGLLTASGGVAMPPTGNSQTSGSPSNPLDLIASASSGTTASNQTFRWQAVNADGTNPSANLNLLFGAGSSAPSPTGLSVAPSGIITFAAGQTFRGTGAGTVTQVDSGAGLAGGPITGSGTLYIPSGRVTNAMLQNPSLTVTAGSGLTGGGSVALGGSTTLSLDPTANLSVSTGTFSSSTPPVVSAAYTVGPGLTYYGQLGTTAPDGNYAGVSGYSGYYGVYGSGTYGVYGSGTGVGVNGTGGALGVYGSGSDFGVFGTASKYGLYGTSSYAAVTGDGGTYGVVGSGTSYGLYGSGSATSTGSTGVYGSGNYYGVRGAGYDGVYGEGSNYGVFGSGNYGVYGYSSNNTGVYGEGPYGVFAEGNLGATGSKSAVVALPDNRVVELYATESPENWFEDFGTGELRNGVAEVALDPTFALAANTETGYHVFLTPKGDCEGLYVTNETARGFQVRELRGGKSNVAFDYRIVAKRRGYESVRMDQLETDAETVEAIREVVLRRPAHRKLILHKPQEPPQPRKVEAPPGAPAVAIPKPPELPKLPAPPTLPKVGAPPSAPVVVAPKPPELPKTGTAPAEPTLLTPKPPEPAKVGAAPTTRAAVTAKPPEPAKLPAPPEPAQK